MSSLGGWGCVTFLANEPSLQLLIFRFLCQTLHMHTTKIKGEAGTQSLVPPFYPSHYLGVTVDAGGR